MQQDMVYNWQFFKHFSPNEQKAKQHMWITSALLIHIKREGIYIQDKSEEKINI